MKSVLILLLSFVFTGIGLAGGWYSAKQQGSGAAAEHGDDDDHDHAPPAAKKEAPPVAGAKPAEEHKHEHKPRFSPQSLQNMGVKYGDLKAESYTFYKSIPAIVTAAPNDTTPLIATVGGTILESNLRPGTVAKSGTVAYKILREPLPRLTLTMTADHLKPAAEEFHTAIFDLRRSQRGMEVLQTELNRVKEFTSGSGNAPALMPKKAELDLRYDVAKATQEYENARENLRLHGLTPEQIDSVAKGNQIEFANADIWVRALQRNGLWTAESAELYETLPAQLRGGQWVIAAIGELRASGLATPALTAWLKSDATAAAHFTDIAALLQQGNSLQRIQTQFNSGALESVIEIKVPDVTGGDWDIAEAAPRAGEKIEAGTRLAVLRNPRMVHLKAMPVGGELQTLFKVFNDKSEFGATPLVEGSGPVLSALKVMQISAGTERGGDAHDGDVGTIGIIPVANQEISNADGYRTWKLRPGVHYTLQVPDRKLDGVFVVPSAAIAEDGPDKLMFIRDGDDFKEAKVAILHMNREVAVLDGKTSELFDGDTVVMQGAFALKLAMKGTSEVTGCCAEDGPSHAGHSHAGHSHEGHSHD